MARSEGFKRILELYKLESKESGVSIVSFCQKNGTVYSQFERWYKNCHNVKVHAETSLTSQFPRVNKIQKTQACTL